MALLICFLPHLPRTLQGRAKTSVSSRVVNELQKLRDLALPDLAALLGTLLPADFFAKAPDAKGKLERFDPPVALFWALLCLVLNPAMPCQEVVGKIRAWVTSAPMPDTKQNQKLWPRHLHRSRALTGRQARQTVLPALEHRAVLPRYQNHHAHGGHAHQDTGHIEKELLTHAIAYNALRRAPSCIGRNSGASASKAQRTCCSNGYR